MRKYVKAHDGMLLANHGALTLGADLFAAYYKMETIEHFAKISLVARLLGGERLLSREEVDAAAGAARPLRHRGAGADLRRCRSAARIRSTARWCRRRRRAGRAAGPDSASRARRGRGARRRQVRDEEIRLTYRELTALIEDAVTKSEVASVISSQLSVQLATRTRAGSSAAS